VDPELILHVNVNFSGSTRMLAPLGRWTGGPVVLKVRGDWVQVRLPNRPSVPVTIT
jgi:hypothetical protein